MGRMLEVRAQKCTRAWVPFSPANQLPTPSHVFLTAAGKPSHFLTEAQNRRREELKGVSLSLSVTGPPLLLHKETQRYSCSGNYAIPIISIERSPRCTTFAGTEICSGCLWAVGVGTYSPGLASFLLCAARSTGSANKVSQEGYRKAKVFIKGLGHFTVLF